MPESAVPRLRRLVRGASTVLALAVGSSGLLALAPPATAATGDTMIAWLEVEDGVLAGNPGRDQGDHGNFSGTGSYTFRDPGMRSTMSFTAPEAGTYPVWIRYSAGGLGNAADDDVTRRMGLLVNGGSRQVLDFPRTFVPGEPDQHDGWERWSWTRTDVTLAAGPNSLAVDCQRNVESGGDETCRLNFDAVQVGGTAPTGGTPATAEEPAGAPCLPSTSIPAGATRLFDGTFASFDGTVAAPRWHKSGSGGYGFQTDCTIRGFRGQGTTWTTTQQAGPYTLGVDFRRATATSASSVYLGSTTNGQPAPTGGYRVRIGADDTGTIVSGDGSVTSAPDAAALAAALEPQGEWNSFAVQVTPARIRLLLNGTPVNAVDRVAGMTGYIGLENRSGDTAAGDVRFRNIYVDDEVALGRLTGPVRRAVKADGTTPNPGGESTLGNLTADALRWATRTPAGGNAKIAFVSPTSLEADLVADGAYPAVTTYARAAAALDDEPLVNMRLTGAQVRSVLEEQWRDAATPLVRLGASDGLTWTTDATRALGDRVTGVRLDGAALNPTGNYSVTVPQSLAGGADGFDTFTDGIVPQVREATTLSALAARVGDAGGTLAPPATQRSVGVRVPDGATSWVAGTTYALDLSSWSFSHPGDPADTSVAVTIAGRPVGTYAVDTSHTDNPLDEDGRVAVRAAVPADLPTGTYAVEVTGQTTGTQVTRQIAVTAAPVTPTPTPTPEPPAPTPTYTPPPVMEKVDARIKVTVKPGRVVARRTRARLVVRVTSAGPTPTGRVVVKAGKKRIRVRLVDGRVVVRLPVFASAGRAKVKVRYRGDEHTWAAGRLVRFRVVRP